MKTKKTSEVSLRQMDLFCPCPNWFQDVILGKNPCKECSVSIQPKEGKK